jgi:hypothetical protein
MKYRSDIKSTAKPGDALSADDLIVLNRLMERRQYGAAYQYIYYRLAPKHEERDWFVNASMINADVGDASTYARFKTRVADRLCGSCLTRTEQELSDDIAEGVIGDLLDKEKFPALKVIYVAELEALVKKGKLPEHLTTLIGYMSEYTFKGKQITAENPSEARELRVSEMEAIPAAAGRAFTAYFALEKEQHKRKVNSQISIAMSAAPEKKTSNQPAGAAPFRPAGPPRSILSSVFQFSSDVTYPLRIPRARPYGLFDPALSETPPVGTDTVTLDAQPGVQFRRRARRKDRTDMPIRFPKRIQSE